jgi:uncharacterized membrane protein YkvA (DUF1232 family)
MRTASPRTWYLSAMAAIKNEAPYLDEWLAFCVSEGIEHVLLYDNGSTDNTCEVLQPWIRAGIVELFDWPVHWKQGAQTKAYADALRRLRGRTRWAAFIDPDEFLFSPTGKTVAEVMRRYEGQAGVIVNWQCYGTSGHKRRPSGLTIESYTRRATSDWARNRRVKTIVDPLLAIEPLGSHLFKVQPGQALVTEDFKPVRVVRSLKWRRRLRHIAARLPYLPFDPYSTRQPWPRQVSVSDLRINHYVTRSEEDVVLKYKDRTTMLDRDRLTHARYHDRNETDDPILVSQAGLVRKIIRQVHAADGPVPLAEWATRAREAHVFDRLRTIAPTQPAIGAGARAMELPAAAYQMSFVQRLKRSAHLIRRDLLALCLAAKDRRVPWYAKALAGVIGAYPVWPVDLIPDVVPVFGYIDDLIIVALGIFFATRLIPANVMADLRSQASRT